MTELLQDLYDSEINVSIYWNWDGGVEVRVGNGTYNKDDNWEAATNEKTIKMARAWLIQTARKLYPNSDFAKKYAGNL